MSKKAAPVSADLRLLDPFWEEVVERIVLPNGLTFIFKADRSAALASVQVWVKTGSIHEGDLLGAGLSHYLEHMLFKGTERRAGREISSSVQAHGGYINAYTTFDRTVYYIDLPSEHAEVAIDLLADAVFHSTLPADEVEKEKNVILREIDMGRDDPDQRLGESLFDTAFRLHPYRLPIIGHRPVFAGVSREDLVGYYKARYVPNNVVVTIVGDLSLAHTRALVEKHFGSVPRARLAPVLVPSEPPPLATRLDHRYEDVEIVRGGLAWQIPGLTHPDAPVLELLAMILGNGDSSTLWQEVREKARLVHTIDASSWNPGSVGLFYLSFTCDAGKRQEATTALLASIARAAKRGFTAVQMRKAIRQLVVGEINTRKTMAGQASRLGSAEVVVGDLNFAREYFERLRAVTSKALVRTIKTYLIPSRLTAVSINPAADIPAVVVSKTARNASKTFEEVRLPNGARLLWQHDPHLPNLHLRFAVRGGPAYEKVGQRGASALLATLLTKDAGAMSAAAVAQAIEEVGGSFTSFAGNNVLGLAVEVLPTDVERALAILGGAVLSPRFKRATFEIERDAQLAELKQDADDVVTSGRKLLRQRFFGSHPLALDSHGDEIGLQAMTPAAVETLFRKLFVSSNAVLAVAGDFSDKSLLPRLKQLLSRLPRAPAPGAEPKFGGPVTVGDFIEIQPREQAIVFQGFPGPGVLDEDFYVADVADELFSGMASRLFERVREEKGLAYFVRSSRVMGIYAGLFSFYAGTAPAHAAEVLTEFDTEIARVSEGKVDAAELLRCQVRIKAAKRQSMQTNASRAMQAALNALYSLPINDWQEFDKKIDAVTIQDLAEFAKRRFRKDTRVQLTVTPGLIK